MTVSYATPNSRTDKLRVDWEKDESVLIPFEIWVIHKLFDVEDELEQARKKLTENGL
jgi:hypothetical protein